MDHCDMDLNELVAKGKAQGYLTYDQVNDYLPDEAVNPEKLDSLLVALDELGIELVTERRAEAEANGIVVPPTAAEELEAEELELPRNMPLPARTVDCRSSATIRSGCI